MDSTVTLIVVRGPLMGRRFSFSGPTTCVIGRSRDCTLVLPMELEHLDVSRHHCVLDLAPPSLHVRDLGSLNGTFVNGKMIGQRGKEEAICTHDTTELESVELSDGDEIQLGQHVAFRVCVSDPAQPRRRRHRRSSGELRFEQPAHS